MILNREALAMQDSVKKSMTIVRFVKKNISVTAFVLIFLLFLILQGFKFLNLSNIQTIFEQAVVVLIVSFGMTFIIMMGSIDLSVGSTVGLSGVIAASVLESTNSTVLAILSGIAVGAAVGIFNGTIHSKRRYLPLSPHWVRCLSFGLCASFIRKVRLL